MNKHIIVITGATGTGKSDLADNLALEIGGEIINVDIGAFYQPLTIGTAKPNLESQKVPYHFFNILNAPQDFCIVQFRLKVIELCEQIWQRGKVPVLVGGSVFYIRSLFYRQHDIAATRESQVVQELELSEWDDQSLWKKLHEIDELRARQLDPNDRYRVIRALAIFKVTGQKPSEFIPIFDPIAPALLIICNRDRDDLYARINQRVHVMLQQGWLQEVKALKETAWEPFLLKKKMMGYDLLLKYLSKVDGHQNLEVITEQIQQQCRNYAKRQNTFLKKLKQGLERDAQLAHYSYQLQEINLTLYDVGLYIRQLLSYISNFFG